MAACTTILCISFVQVNGLHDSEMTHTTTAAARPSQSAELRSDHILPYQMRICNIFIQAPYLSMPSLDSSRGIATPGIDMARHPDGLTDNPIRDGRFAVQ